MDLAEAGGDCLVRGGEDVGVHIARDDYPKRTSQGNPHPQNYSIRMPLIARAITSCWISLVPSKIVWLTLTGFVSDAHCCHVPLTRCCAIRVSE